MDHSASADQAPSIIQVARRAGVSLATASRVMSNADYPVSANMRQRVQQAATELHYIPNPLARSLKGQRSQMLALLMGNSADPYFAGIARGVIEEAEAQGYLVIMCHTDRDIEKEAHYLRVLRDYHAAGVLFAGSGDNDPASLARQTSIIQQLQQRGTALVTLTQHLLPVPSIQPDNFNGARQMAHHLIALGHRRIAFVGGPSNLIVSNIRLQGYMSALAEAGITIDPAWLSSGNFTIESGAQAVQSLLQLPAGRRPTAIFAINDEMAFGILHTLRTANIAVPATISVCGFDDLPMAPLVAPALTTVHVPLRTLGHEAVKLALTILHEKSQPEARVLPLSLVIRDSTAPPAA